MSVFIAPIVEGHGEVVSVPPLLHRVWNDLFSAPERLEVLPPNRQSRGLLVHANGVVLTDSVRKAVAQVRSRMNRESGSRGVVLILIDAEKDCPALLASGLLNVAKAARSDATIACVLAKQMFENWVAAGAVTLGGVNGLPDPLPSVVNAEDMGGKAWVEQQLRSVAKNRAYSETLDCVEFVRAMDVVAARQNSPSFDKLCREVAKLLPPPPPAPPPDPTTP